MTPDVGLPVPARYFFFAAGLKGDRMVNVVDAATVIGIDPHKASWTAAAVDDRHRVLGGLRVAADQQGYDELRAFAAQWPSAVWAVEGAAGLGAPLCRRLLTDGDVVVDVPAKFAARIRALDNGHGRKNDPADAASVAVAARARRGSRPVVPDPVSESLRLLSDRRSDLTRQRTQTVNRLHALLVQLIPGGAPRGLTADAAAALVRPVRPRDSTGRTRRQLATDLIGDLRRLDRQLSELATAIGEAVRASSSTLPTLPGLGPILAAVLIGRVGLITRFPSEAHFASWTGTAPIEASSGDVKRHRLSRAGDRQVNSALHTMAIVQVRCGKDGATYYRRKRAAGLSHAEALRCLKRRLAAVVYRQMVADQRPDTTTKTGPGRTPGGDSISSATPNPDGQLFGQVTTRTRR